MIRDGKISRSNRLVGKSFFVQVILDFPKFRFTAMVIDIEDARDCTQSTEMYKWSIDVPCYEMNTFRSSENVQVTPVRGQVTILLFFAAISCIAYSNAPINVHPKTRVVHETKHTSSEYTLPFGNAIGMLSSSIIFPVILHTMVELA